MLNKRFEQQNTRVITIKYQLNSGDCHPIILRNKQNKLLFTVNLSLITYEGSCL